MARRARLIITLGLATLLAATAAAAPALAQRPGLDRAALRQTLDAVTAGGIYGTYSHVRDGRESWRGASGVADKETGRPARPDMYHRIGSITKTFVATAVLQQVERGAVDLDAPVGRYLPGLLPDQRITVRMLLNHTSHISDYDHIIFSTLDSVEANRTRKFTRKELVEIGLGGGTTGQPGDLPGSYSNTNYAVLGLLLDKVTGIGAERYITRHVIKRAGLSDTFFPRTPYLPRPHSKAYESLGGAFDPPRDFSVYDMSWGGMAGAIVSTMPDLNRFNRALLSGRLVGAAQLAQMRTTVPVTPGPGVTETIDYGLGIFTLPLPCGRVWGHDGGVIGMGTMSFSSEDGSRQFSSGVNLMNHPDAAAGAYAQVVHLVTALCGSGSATSSTVGELLPALSPLAESRAAGPLAAQRRTAHGE